MSFVDGTMSREEFDDGALEFANDGHAQRRIAMDASSARYVELEADETQVVAASTWTTTTTIRRCAGVKFGA